MRGFWKRFEVWLPMKAKAFNRGYVEGQLAVSMFANRLTAGQVGAISVGTLIQTIILAFVAFIFIISFTPTIEGTSTANISNSFTKSMAEMAKWVIPVGAIVGVLYGVFRLFQSSRD